MRAKCRSIPGTDTLCTSSPGVGSWFFLPSASGTLCSQEEALETSWGHRGPAGQCTLASGFSLWPPRRPEENLRARVRLRSFMKLLWPDDARPGLGGHTPHDNFFSSPAGFDPRWKVETRRRVRGHHPQTPRTPRKPRRSWLIRVATKRTISFRPTPPRDAPHRSKTESQEEECGGFGNADTVDDRIVAGFSGNGNDG